MRHTVAEHSGMVLGYESEGVESMEIASRIDVEEVGERNGVVERKHGKSHLDVRITFKDGHAPTWEG